MRKITITVAAFLAASAMSATEVTSSGLELTIASGKNTTSTDITLPAGSYIIDKGSNSSLTVAVSMDGGKTVVTPETDGTFKVVPTKETTYTITVTATANVAKETSTTVKVAPDATALKVIQDKYTTQMASLYSKANSYSEDATLQKLALDASELVNEISNYGIEEYIEYQGTGKVAGIEKCIIELGDKISAAQANYTQYQAALTVYNDELQPELDDLTATYNSKLKDIEGKDVDMSEYTKTYSAAKSLVEDFKESADDAYKAGTAADLFSSSEITKKTTDIKVAIADAKKAIESGTTNDLSYTNVKTAIANAKLKYYTVAQNIYTDLFHNSKYADESNDLYTDTYTDALTKLNKLLVSINQIAESNEADYKAGKANATTQAEYEKQLNEVTVAMEKVKDEVLAKVANWRSYYAAANADIAAHMQAPLNEVKAVISGDTYGNAQDYFKSDIYKIQSSIDAVQAKVDAKNKDHALTSATEDFGVTGYTSDEDAIITAINALKPLVENAKCEIDDNNTSEAYIEEVEKTYTDSKTAVNDAKNETYNYIVGKNAVFNAGGKFEGLETAIADSLDKFNSERLAAYGKSMAEFNKTPKYSHVFKEALKGDDDKLGRLSVVNGNIKAYKDVVIESKGYYKTAYDAIAEYNTALAALEKTATNTDVTIDGNADGKSYATAIAEYKSKIVAIQTALDNAYNNNTDAKLLAALKDVADNKLDASIKTGLETLATNYNGNETNWAKNVLEATKSSMLAQAETLVTFAKSGLPASYSSDDYGLKSGVLNDSLEAISADLTKIETSIEEAEDATASTENIALLSQINAELKTIQTRVNNLQKTAETVKNEYAAETAAYKSLLSEIDELNLLLNGGTYNNVKYLSVAEINKGIDANNTTGNASQRRSFDDQVNKLLSYVGAQKTKIEASYAAETVRKDQQTVTNAETNVTTYGYNDILAGLKTTVNNVRGYAGNEAANDKANIEFNAEKTKADITNAIAKAATDVSEVTDGTAKTYFNNLLNGYATDYEKIESDQKNYYEKSVTTDEFTVCGSTAKYENLTDTKKNMAAYHAGLKDRLDKLVKNIEAVKTNAEANQVAYNTLTANYVNAGKNWDAVFKEVSTAPTSTYHEVAINTLNTAQKDLNKFKATIDDDFANGACWTNQSKRQIELDSINTVIGTLTLHWASNYDQAITHDNATRYETFNAAYKLLADTYKDRINIVTELSKTSAATDVTSKLLEVTGEGGVYTYAEKISSLKSKADNEYNATVSTVNVPDLYDVEEVNTSTANTYKDEIKIEAQKYIDAVNNKAKEIFNTEHANALLLYNDAITEIQSKTVATEAEAKTALADVWSILEKSAGAQNLDNFAVVYEKTYKAQLASVTTLIAADKEVVAASVWADRLNSATKLSESEKAEIQNFSDKSGGKVNNVDDYKVLLNSIDVAVAEWNKIEDGKKYAGFTSAFSKLSSEFFDSTTKKIVTHTATYNKAKSDFDAYNANDVANNEIKALIADAQKVLDEAESFISDLIVVHEVDNEIQGYQRRIESETASAEWCHDHNCSDEHLDEFKTYNANIISYIQDYVNGVSAYAFAKEKARIDVELGQLQLDYENATANNVDKLDSLNSKYKPLISGYFAKNTEIYSNYTGKKEGVTAAITKAAFLALEKEIGVTKNELTELYNAGASAEAQATMQAVIDSLSDVHSALVAQLADCHQAVKTEYGITVDGMGVDIAAVQTELNTAVTDGTVLLYQDLITTNTEQIANQYAGLSDKIAEMENPYVVNDAKYDELTTVLNGYMQRLQSVYDKTAEYNNKVFDNGTNYRDAQYKTLKDRIEVEQKRIDRLNATGKGLTSDSEVINLTDAINMYEDDLSYNDNDLAISGNLISGETEYSLTSLWKAVKDKIEANVYSDNYRDTLWTELNNIYCGNVWGDDEDCPICFIYNYNYDARYGVSDLNGKSQGIKWTDIDGNKFYKDNVEIGIYTTATAEHDAIKERIAEIRARIEALDKAADKIVGDADGNGEVGINDYTYILNIILENSIVIPPAPGTPAFDLADANCDGKIDVADAVAVVNAILGNTSSAKVRKTPVHDFGSSLSLTNEGSGYTQRLNINLKNGITFTGGQFDIILPEGMTVADVSLGDRASNMELRYARLSNGATRVLISSVENNDIEGSEGNVVSIDVNVSTDYDGSPVEISNGVFSDAKGRAYFIGVEGEATGINTVTTAEYVKGKIYSVGGQLLDGLRKGVNIIRNSDGTSQKVIVK